MSLKTSLQTLAYKGKYAVTDHSSQILTGATIVGSIGAFGLGIYTAVKKLPEIRAKFEEDVNKIEDSISLHILDARAELDMYSTETITKIITDPGTDEETERNREHMIALQDIVATGPQLEAAAYTKAKALYGWRVFVAFLPSLILLGGSVGASITMLTQTLKAAATSGAVIAGLTAELASTRNDLKSVIGEEAMAVRDHDNTIKEIEDSCTEPDESGMSKRKVADLRKQLYTRVYDSHLLCGMSTEDCLSHAQSDLWNIQKLKNDLFLRRGRMYFGDILKALGYETTECGQNTGWVVRDYPNEYDGVIDFGCWTTGKNPRTGEDMQVLNPANINEDGTIVLNFNVEGPVEWMIEEARRQGATFRAKDIPTPVIPAELFPDVE